MTLTLWPPIDVTATDNDDRTRWIVATTWPGTATWAHCQHRRWQIAWGNSPWAAITNTSHRPTPWWLARRGPCTCESDPATVNVHRVVATVNQPGRPSRDPRHIWRHWHWWRRNSRVTPIPRGDLSTTPPPPFYRYPPAARRREIDLSDPRSYGDLIHQALLSDFWLTRRGRRAWIAHLPPDDDTPRIRWSRTTHHSRGDLTWAPRPPSPPRSPRARPRIPIASAVKVTLLILILGPLGLLLLLAGVGWRRGGTHGHLPPYVPMSSWSTMAGANSANAQFTRYMAWRLTDGRNRY